MGKAKNISSKLIDQNLDQQIKSFINRLKVRKVDQKLKPYVKSKINRSTDQQIKSKVNGPKIGSTDLTLDQKIKRMKTISKYKVSKMKKEPNKIKSNWGRSDIPNNQRNRLIFFVAGEGE